MHFQIFFDTAANATASANGFNHELDSIKVLDLNAEMNLGVVHVPWNPDYRGSFVAETMDSGGVGDCDTCDSWD